MRDGSVSECADELYSRINPLVTAESVMDAVELFINGHPLPHFEAQTSLTFLLVAGREGTGKTFLCDEIERVASIHAAADKSIQGEIEFCLSSHFAYSPLYCITDSCFRFHG